jgi:hypothetical protein
LTVDRKAGVIKGVKILGRESANRRRYSPDAIRRAARLYEGAKVRIDHPRKPNESRSSYDNFGRLRNVAVDGAGELFGDLHYLKSHQLAESVAEDAERISELGVFGLSHNVEADGERGPDGVVTVVEIVAVHSVDLVADPATVTNLQESQPVTEGAARSGWTPPNPNAPPADPAQLGDWLRGIVPHDRPPQSVKEGTVTAPGAQVPTDPAAVAAWMLN